ncbi:Geranylgeranyl transferase type-2 subunit beta [Gracilariopsis chorda]|uniref:Geranylgeranyl transferase type-2 subunit beta n=1 Tax=Gracilariopsis chorda TaxID=448386 RepID=A0A2V3IN58_9FLOR|nr:Geranylgeranyl transferase type-2 subunit beta [Gracilariopsis chorda]|eukprot:PXF43503.1 Geranylgeranyl transferase type-2 subunit beta [Gracilariopsis chorda]
MASSREQLRIDKHVAYIVGLEKKTKTTDALYFTDHKRLSGVYWALSSLALMRKLHVLPQDTILDYVLSCYHSDVAAFSGNTDQDPHLLYTLSGVQILAMYDKLHLIDADRVVANIAALQRPDGSFAGDKWGEIDTRFTYCALLCAAILRRSHLLDVPAAVRYVLRCQNFDGGFGCIAGAESHAGQVFCCVGSLYLADAMDEMTREDRERLALWLCERQLPCGGLNGRPDKLEDVCYSWWVLSSLKMLGHVDWIDADKLIAFIGRSEDDVDGGFADRPGDMSDVFHTFFALAGLSLLGNKQLADIHPAYALTTDVVQRVTEPSA